MGVAEECEQKLHFAPSDLSTRHTRRNERKYAAVIGGFVNSSMECVAVRAHFETTRQHHLLLR